MKFAVQQNGFAFYGVGETQEGAIRDALKWVEPGTTFDDLKSQIDNSGRNHGEMRIVEVSDELGQLILDKGGDVDCDEIKPRVFDIAA